jgi:hypothetical protein
MASMGLKFSGSPVQGRDIVQMSIRDRNPSAGPVRRTGVGATGKRSAAAATREAQSG